MQIKKVSIQNFYSIKKIDFDFTKYKGVTLIEGENKDTGGSNGAGKSALFEAVVWGLYGKTIRKSTEAALINVTSGKDCKVIMHVDDDIVIERCKKPTSLQFRKGKDNLTKANALETQKEIEKYLKVDYKTFMTSMVMGQHNALEFLGATPDDKRLIIKNFLNLEDIFKTREKVKSFKSQFNNEVKTRTFIIKEYLKDVKELKDKLSIIEKDKEKYKFTDDLKNIKMLDILKKEEETGVLSKKIKKIKDDVIPGLKDALFKLHIKANKGIHRTAEVCGECNSEYVVEQTDKDLEKLEYQINQLADLKSIKEQEINSLLVKKVSIDIPIKSKDLGYFQEFLDLCSFEDSYKERLEQLQQKIDEQEVKKLNNQKKYESMKFWEKAFSEQGLIQYVIRNVLNYLNVNCNKYVSLLSAGKMKIEFDEKLNETIQCGGSEIQHISLSGGEKRKINIAIMLALQDLLAIVTGSKTNILFLDEIAENLDADGINGLYILMRELRKSKDLFVITHNNNLKSVLDFGNKVTIIKARGYSRLKETL
tara:strand:+ start:2945 stop:4552 length:1608 start_codon:yes stop_codon:yes gene_type:complete